MLVDAIGNIVGTFLAVILSVLVLTLAVVQLICELFVGILNGMIDKVKVFLVKLRDLAPIHVLYGPKGCATDLNKKKVK